MFYEHHQERVLPLALSSARFLPDYGYAGTLVARVWRPEVQGPAGKRTQSKLHGSGQNEFVPWQLGAIT